MQIRVAPAVMSPALLRLARPVRLLSPTCLSRNRSKMYVALCFLLLALCFVGCERYSNEGSYREASRITGGGNPALGKQDIRRYGCQGCHSIPGIRDARGVVGPPLDHLANRIYLAGELPNTTENLMHWIQRPHEIHPHTAMPEMGVTEHDARDIAAYLYTLK